jgi:hypothetical protein
VADVGAEVVEPAQPAALAAPLEPCRGNNQEITVSRSRRRVLPACMALTG